MVGLVSKLIGHFGRIFSYYKKSTKQRKQEKKNARNKKSSQNKDLTHRAIFIIE